MATIEKDTGQRGVITMDKIVRECCNDIGAGLERYEQFLQWAQEANLEFKQDLARELTVVELPMTAWKAIEWPVDCVVPVLVGARYKGKLIVFTNDQDIPLYHDVEDGERVENTVESFSDEDIEVVSDKIVRFHNTNSHGEDTGGIWGFLAKDNGVGYFRHDRKRRETQLNPMINNQTVYFEYVAAGHSPCSATIVPLAAKKMHKDYVHWQRLRFNRSSAKWERDEAERIYWRELQKVAERMDDTTIADIVEAAIDGYSGSPHF